MKKISSKPIIKLIALIGISTINSLLADDNYSSILESNHRNKCFYGYVSLKTGDHLNAIRIFEDCIERWQDAYSYIGLSQIYETGVGVEKNLPYANELLRKAAELEGGYSSLAKYNYALNLFQGKGVDANPELAVYWMKKSASEGFSPAIDYLTANGIK